MTERSREETVERMTRNEATLGLIFAIVVAGLLCGAVALCAYFPILCIVFVPALMFGMWKLFYHNLLEDNMKLLEAEEAEES
jgi:hypothetical protein